MSDHIIFETDSIVFVNNNFNQIFSKIESHSRNTIEFSGATINDDVRLIGIETPIENTDAVNKAYVDSIIGGSPGGNNNSIQFNNGGSFGGINTFLYNSNTDELNFSGNVNFTNTTDSNNPNEGAIVIDGGVGIKKNLNVAGNIKADIITTTSDINLKNNITKITNNSLDILKNINCVKYNIGDYLQYGVIAQEIQNIPELKDIVFKDCEENLSVAYNNFIPLIIESIKQLKKENDLLKKYLDL